MKYVPANGWFDLTQKPKGMSKTVHQKIQDLQMVVRCKAEKFKDPEVKKNNQVTYNQLRELSAKLQQIVLSNWKLEECEYR